MKRKCTTEENKKWIKTWYVPANSRSVYTNSDIVQCFQCKMTHFSLGNFRLIVMQLTMLSATVNLTLRVFSSSSIFLNRVLLLRGRLPSSGPHKTDVFVCLSMLLFEVYHLNEPHEWRIFSRTAKKPWKQWRWYYSHPFTWQCWGQLICDFRWSHRF